ncbi:hypothetical protein [Couchioplanes caeruleus]|uniref:Secreted protein n=2 Tax=Couchioplanes caeruleus TaxID=56438 RepID=A0A1K0GBB1_9ACTN|nr:hypothetical protein [Couchioplanes caeruleus]OJF14530.1 hypothetical protein BG844_09355 [Couchioplanes caeruleus subsp. caeruleus]ROP21312.1 hypothetical protein EDD30_7713 [Couchioplanes caeruleus]
MAINITSKRTHFLSGLVMCAAAGAALLGMAVPASAATSQDVRPAGADSRRAASVVLPPGGRITIPTWIFGNTQVCATNLGPSTPGRLEVKAQLPWAGPENIDVPGFVERKCISRFWGGVPVDLTNVSSSSPVLVEHN